MNNDSNNQCPAGITLTVVAPMTRTRAVKSCGGCHIWEPNLNTSRFFDTIDRAVRWANTQPAPMMITTGDIPMDARVERVLAETRTVPVPRWAPRDLGGAWPVWQLIPLRAHPHTRQALETSSHLSLGEAIEFSRMLAQEGIPWRIVPAFVGETSAEYLQADSLNWLRELSMGGRG